MSDKRYIITIVEKTTETKICGKEWQPISKNPDADYGYTPEIEKQVLVEREIFKQNTDKLSLVEVIKAVNGLG